MSYFRLSVGLCHELQRLYADFWWGSSDKGRKTHWLAWPKMCKPKYWGGMDFRDVVAFNQSMLAKQGWRLLCDPSSLMARVLKARYLHSTSFLKCKLGNLRSFVLRSFFWGREVLLKGVRWRIGDGCDVNIFED
ncbi:hypothetical protein ACOSQ4_011177 [Xanthoceras sorbifolium]